jgi:hypothetical protein
VRTRRTTKAEVDHLTKRAREGDHATRAAAATAYRVHVARLAAGHDDEATPLIDAGAELEAETAFATCKLLELYRQVNFKQS